MFDSLPRGTGRAVRTRYDERQRGYRYMHGASLLRIVGFLGFAVFLLITFTRLPYFLAGLTRMPPRLEPADAIVVLAATINATGVLSQASFRRAIHGIACGGGRSRGARS